MPFIVIGSYFNFIKRTERTKWWAMFFLVISILYALSYAYFSYKVITGSKKWKELTTESKEKEGKK